MAGVVKKSFESPDERRTPDKTQVEVVDLGSVKAARVTMQPGWRWSECIKPIVGTDSCQIHHEGMLSSGHMRSNPVAVSASTLSGKSSSPAICSAINWS